MRNSNNTARIFEPNTNNPNTSSPDCRGRHLHEPDRTRAQAAFPNTERTGFGDVSSRSELSDRPDEPRRVPYENRFGNICYRDAVCALCEKTVSLALNIPLDSLQAPTRCTAESAHARHIAMYLCHTTFSLLLTEIGLHFGRDRSTVSYACALVEDRRDDPDFDILLCQLESLLLDARDAMTLLSVPMDVRHLDRARTRPSEEEYASQRCEGGRR